MITKLATGATRPVMCAVVGILSPVLGKDVQGQSSGCSAVVNMVVESAIAADSAGPPFGSLMGQRNRLTLPESGATSEEVCHLALTAALQNHHAGRASIGSQLERLYASGRSTPDVQFGLALIRSQRGEHNDVLGDSALTSSTDPLVRFELARALLLAGHADVGQNLIRSAVAADPAAAGLLYHFTYPVLSAESRTALARAPAGDRGRLLLGEWDRMAWSSGLRTAERLTVHFRRIAHADSIFFGTGRPLSDSTEVITSGRPQPDPRWEIYIRFGEPARVVRTVHSSSGSGPSSEQVTWVYADPTQRHPMLFHFSGANGRYSLITSAGCRLEWLSDRASLSPRIGQVYQACTEKSDFTRAIDQLRRETLSKYQEYRYREFVVPSRLGARFAYRLYTFINSTRATPEVIAVAHVPAEEMPRSGTLRAGAFLRSEAGETRSQMVDYAATDSSDAMVAITIPSVSEGDYSYRVRTSDLEFQEGFVYGGEYTVKLSGTGKLKMSDLVIARAGTTGPLRRATEELQPILGAITDSSFDLYGEAYGVPAGEAVAVEITISRRRFLRRTTEVTLKFTDTASDDGVFLFRQLVQHDLDPGEYEIMVTLHSASAGLAEQSTTIEIRKPAL